MTCIFDASNKGASIRVGRNGVSAGAVTTGSGWESIIGTVSLSAGKKIVEFYVPSYNNDGNGSCLGFGNASIDLNSYVGHDSNSIGLQLSDGWLSPSGGWSNPTHSGGYVIQFAIDLDNKLIWARTDRNLNWNNSGTANPATGTGGLTYSTSGALFPACSILGNLTKTNSAIFSLNAGGFPFALSTPSGFSAWDSGTPTVDTVTGGSTPTAWDAGFLGTGFSRGGTGNRTITKNTSDTWTSAIISSFRRGGLAYAELTFVSSYTNKNTLIGFCDHTLDLTSYLGHDRVSTGVYFGSNDIFGESNVSIGTWWTAQPNVGDVLAIAVDLNRGIWWIKNLTQGDTNWNGSASADPVAGTGGFPLGAGGFDGAYFALSSNGSSPGGAGPDQSTLNVAGSFSGTPPSGYSAWEAAAAAVNQPLGGGLLI